MTNIFKTLWRLITGRGPRDGTSPFAAGQGPARLVILRHAEKTGKKSDPGLSPAGTARAARLAAYIPETFGKPAFLFAAATSKRSRRPVETLEPLADALRLPIDATFDDAEVRKLVKALHDGDMFRAKSGVISWRHSDIPRLVAALGAPEDFLPGWAEDDYITVVVIDYRDGAPPAARRMQMPF